MKTEVFETPFAAWEHWWTELRPLGDEPDGPMVMRKGALDLTDGFHILGPEHVGHTNAKCAKCGYSHGLGSSWILLREPHDVMMHLGCMSEPSHFSGEELWPLAGALSTSGLSMCSGRPSDTGVAGEVRYDHLRDVLYGFDGSDWHEITRP